MTDFKTQLDNYYFDKLLAYQKVLKNTGKRIPLCLIIAQAIIEYLNKEYHPKNNFNFYEFGVFENFDVVDNNLVHFDFSSRLNDKMYYVYMNRDFHITKIRITDTNVDKIKLDNITYIGDFKLESEGKTYIPNDCKIKVDLEYRLDIGRKILGALILDESEEFKMFEYLEQDKYAVYHYLAEDFDINRNIGIWIIPSVYAYATN